MWHAYMSFDKVFALAGTMNAWHIFNPETISPSDAVDFIHTYICGGEL